MLVQAGVCVGRTVELLLNRRLHLRRSRIGTSATLPDGRTFIVFRESISDGDSRSEQVTLAVWFHLRGIPSGSRVRRFLFERLCLVNTMLFAGFAGYFVKLWMVNPDTADYAGLYSWRSVEEADVYARYIVSVLTPVSLRGSVGYQILPNIELDDLLSPQSSPLSPDRGWPGSSEGARGERSNVRMLDEWERPEMRRLCNVDELG